MRAPHGPQHPRSWESISFRIGRGKVTLRAATSDLCRCRSNLARAQFRATGQRDGGHATTAHLPERHACSCEGPKKAHRNLVGLRRTASRSPRSVLSARASSRSFITAIGVGRRDFTVWTGRQRALLGPGCPCPAPYAGWCPSLPKRIGRTEVRSPRPFRALVALAGRNLPPLCSPPRRRAGLLAMSQNERAYANYSRLIYSPLEHMDGVRRS